MKTRSERITWDRRCATITRRAAVDHQEDKGPKGGKFRSDSLVEVAGQATDATLQLQLDEVR